jgi:hypothetical protein
MRFLPLLAFALAACGKPDNVGACEDWLDAVECGDYDYSTVVDCSTYEDYDCDVSAYFDCLTDNTVCDESTGVPDTSGWTACASELECK